MGISGTSGPIPPIKPSAAPEGPLEVTPKGGQEIKEFQGPAERGVGAQKTDKPSPMAVAEQMGHGKTPLTQPELQDKLSKLQGIFSRDRDDLQTADVRRVPPENQIKLQGFLGELERGADDNIGDLNAAMGRIAKSTDVEYNARARGPGESIIEFITGWIDGSQNTLSEALTNVSSVQNPDPGRLLQLQYSVQRATQRAELFSSIISSAVGGIRTIMTTQIG